jgi:hypothetical protein
MVVIAPAGRRIMESSSALSTVSAGLELGSSRESFPDSFDRQRGATLGRQSRHRPVRHIPDGLAKACAKSADRITDGWLGPPLVPEAPGSTGAHRRTKNTRAGARHGILLSDVGRCLPHVGCGPGTRLRFCSNFQRPPLLAPCPGKGGGHIVGARYRSKAFLSPA